MSTTFSPRSDDIGAGNKSDYSFDFLAKELTDIRILITDADFEPICDVRGDDTEFIDNVDFDPLIAGGIVNLVDDLAAGYHIAIIQSYDEPAQEHEFKNKSDFTLARFERALDNQNVFIQSLAYFMKRCLRIGDNLIDETTFDPTIPVNEADADLADHLIAFNADGNGFKISDESTTSLAAQAAAALASQIAAAASAVAAAASAVAAALSAAAAAVSAAAALVSETNAAASAAAAAATAAGLTGTNVIDKFTGDDVTTVFNLSVDPGTESNVDIYISGVHQDDTNYTVAGQVLTFVTAPPTDVANNIIVKMSALLAGVPSDGSVTVEKLSVGVKPVIATEAGLSTDEVVVFDPTAGNIIYTMPPTGATGSGRELTLIHGSASGNYVRLIGDGADLLNGQATYPTDLMSYDSSVWVCTGAAWLRKA